MKQCRSRGTSFASFALTLVLLHFDARVACSQTSNGVLREVYSNVAGNTIAELTSHPSFPSSPTLETVQPIFEAPTDIDESYGQRMRALLLPPVTLLASSSRSTPSRPRP